MRNTLGTAKDGGRLKRVFAVFGVVLLSVALSIGVFAVLSYRAVEESLKPAGTVDLPAGAVVTTKSGLTLRIPRGATASIRPSDGDPAVEVVFVEFAGRQWSASVVSSSVGSTAKLDPARYHLIASSEQSRVTVYETTATSIPALAETHLPGSLRGRVIPLLHEGGTVRERGLALVRRVWSELGISGADLP